MNARVDHLIDEALALPAEERSAVALALLDSLGGEDEAAVSQAWAEEVRRRRQELRSGAVRTVPWEEAKARLSAL
jgi:putative addiction module component (TIGR02574 family)